jgi:hypothetical protein
MSIRAINGTFLGGIGKLIHKRYRIVRMLDLFCGRWGWSKAFAARGWECIGIDLVRPPETPENCAFIQWDILLLSTLRDYKADFICASSPCEEFSMHGMKCFHPAPKYPSMGIDLFNHTRKLCKSVGVPYIMENVRAAQQFVGNAKSHCGPFYLWGTGVPPLLPQGIRKGLRLGNGGFTGKEQVEWRRKHDPAWNYSSGSEARKEATAQIAAIPKELASCVADYAERICKEEPNAQRSEKG